MEKHYKHLNAKERAVILAEHQRGSILRQIGRIVCLKRYIVREIYHHIFVLNESVFVGFCQP
jgi:hypothetical protein